MRKPSGSLKEQVYDKETINQGALQHLRKWYVQTAAKERILQLLFYAPLEEFALSEIASYAQVSKSTASDVIQELQQEEYVTLIKHPLLWRIQANYGNLHFKQEKILYNLSLIFRSGLVDYLDRKFRHPKAIILFGSFRKGEDTLNSDIDIAIEDDVVQKTTGLKIQELEKFAKDIGKEFEENIGREIKIHLFNKKTVDLNLFNSIANGIVLSGFLEVKK